MILLDLSGKVRDTLAVRVHKVHGGLFVIENFVGLMPDILILTAFPAVQEGAQSAQQAGDPQGDPHQRPDFFRLPPRNQCVQDPCRQENGDKGRPFGKEPGEYDGADSSRHLLMPDFHAPYLAGEGGFQRNSVTPHGCRLLPRSIFSARRRAPRICRFSPSDCRGCLPRRWYPFQEIGSGHRTGWRPAGGK